MEGENTIAHDPELNLGPERKKILSGRLVKFE